MTAVLHLSDLHVRRASGPPVLSGVSLALRAGRIAAVVGETGSGKTTVLNSVLGLLPDGLERTSGTIRLRDADLDPPATRAHLGRDIGYVPQDARSGLNPLQTAYAAVAEAAARCPGRGDAESRIKNAFKRAGLSDEFVASDARRRPGRLSGGQCQRVLIAQAVVNEPALLLLDEPTASLDPATRAAVQATLRDIAAAGTAVVFVTHDLAALPGFADDLAVLYLGRVVESGPAAELLAAPKHPYLRLLLGCLPPADRRVPLSAIPGEIPTSAAGIPGCVFHPRCDVAEPRCREIAPSLDGRGGERKAACHVS